MNSSIILASSSPRRIEMLKKNGIEPIIIPSSVDEGIPWKLSMEQTVMYLAAISLVVGGIGIMNIMLVSVTERTREIGIRKSLGARTKDIMIQFLIEAMILSGIGGIIGTILGVGIASAGMSLANIDIVIEPSVILLAVGFSAIVGMFFGLYPARKAAKLDPIDALRYE
jgi:putative ABC transport system permease protein